MSWDDLDIEDLSEIPDRYLISWLFLNAFFKAFQERADFIEGANRAVTYDDIILTGPQVSHTSLSQRFESFHSNVLSCFTDTTWYKEATWLELSSFISGEAIDDDWIGLGVINIEEWDEQALKNLLTEDVYDLIFASFSFATSSNPAYWSGLYKLLDVVMKYRKLSIRTAYEPTPTEPYLVINGFERGGASASENGESGNADTLFSSVVGAANSNPSSSNNGELNLMYSRVSSESQSLAGHTNAGGKVNNVQNYASASYGKVTSDPFCVVPASMNIETLLYRKDSTYTERADAIDVTFPTVQGGSVSWSQTGKENKSNPIIASKTQSGSWGPQPNSEPKIITTKYSPDQATWLAKGAENPKFGVSFDVDRCKVNIGSLPNVVDSNGLANLQSPMQGHPWHFSSTVNSSATIAAEKNHYEINLAMCELPQAEFDYPAQE